MTSTGPFGRGESPLDKSPADTLLAVSLDHLDVVQHDHPIASQARKRVPDGVAD